MLGINLVRHSARMIFINYKEVLRIGIVPISVYAVLMVLLFGSARSLNNGLEDAFLENLNSFSWQEILAIFCTAIAALFWFIVGWHRFVLLEEYPAGWFPTFKPKAMLAYFGRALLLGLIAMFAMVPISLLLGVTGSVWAIVVLGPVAFFFVGVFITQWSIILPAAAIGKPIGFDEASKIMAGSYSTIFVVALVPTVASLAAQFLLTGLSSIGFVSLSTVLGLLIWAFLGLLNVSILTTLYGYYVEERPI